MVEKRSLGEKVFDVFNLALLILAAFLFLYPMWYVLVASLSSGTAIAKGQVSLWPVQFNIDAYRRCLPIKKYGRLISTPSFMSL